MHITVQVEPSDAVPAAVEYRWDTDTAILTASLADAPARADGVSGSVELAGSDGSWVILDVKGGSVRGVEIAVWPDVHKLPALRAPADAEVARLLLPAPTKTGVAVLQMDTTLVAEADQTERTIHFQLGSRRPARTVCIGRDLLVDVDEQHGIKGIWLLNVPPFPGDE